MPTIQKKKAKLRNKADKLYQELGRKMYNHCMLCGGEYSCLHHYHPKSTCSALRYNIDNGIPICSKCHLRIHASDDPTLNENIIKLKGVKWVDKLQEIRRTTFVKPSLSYYEEIINELLRKTQQLDK